MREPASKDHSNSKSMTEVGNAMQTLDSLIKKVGPPIPPFPICDDLSRVKK